MTLAELLGELATELPDVTGTPTPGGEFAWTRDQRPFAILSRDGATAEFLLDGPVAAAAYRTPDAVSSERGEGWVRFAPTVLDEYAVDRARAWYLSAHRRARAAAH